MISAIPMRFNHFAIAFALILPACASVDPAAERALVDNRLAERTRIAPASLQPPAGTVLDMDAAVALGLANNHALRADLADLALARAAQIEAGRPPNPLLGIAWLPHGDEPDVFDVDLTASLMGLVATPWRRAAARDRYDAAQAQAVLRAVDFVAELRIAWIDAVAAAQRADLAGRIDAAAQAALVVAEVIDAAGNAPRIELVREQAFARQSSLDAQRARHDAAMARLDLLVMLGLSPDADIVLPDHLDPAASAAGEGVAFDGLEAEVMEASLPLAMARLQLDAASREAGLESADSLLEHAEIGGIWEREDGHWSKGVSLETALPVFDLGQARRAAARVRAVQAADRHAQIELEIRAGLSRAVQSEQVARSSALRMRDEVLPATAGLMDETLRRYNAMQVGTFDLIAAVQMQARAGQAYADALADAARARARLEQLRAGGSPQAVAMTSGANGEAAAASADGGH